jgi:hypothetical protein
LVLCEVAVREGRRERALGSDIGGRARGGEVVVVGVVEPGGEAQRQGLSMKLSRPRSLQKGEEKGKQGANAVSQREERKEEAQEQTYVLRMRKSRMTSFSS